MPRFMVMGLFVAFLSSRRRLGPIYYPPVECRLIHPGDEKASLRSCRRLQPLRSVASGLAPFGLAGLVTGFVLGVRGIQAGQWRAFVDLRHDPRLAAPARARSRRPRPTELPESPRRHPRR